MQTQTIQKYRVSKNNLIETSQKLLTDFQLTEHTSEIYDLLVEYINKDPKFEKRALKTNKGNKYFSLKKGLFFISRPGSGKSFVFEELLKNYFNFFPSLKYRETNVYKLQGLYSEHGLNAVSTFNNSTYGLRTGQSEYNIYVDDFGREAKTIKHYGNELYFIDHFIDLRSRLQRKHNVVTHGSSNLNLLELKEFYSSPTFSRMFQLFNFVIINSQIDFRTI